jgi:molybdate/tungstate transport system substrate-binding protein
MTDDIGPAFHTATGYTVSGTSGDSGTLANEIKGKVLVGDVYLSANPSKDEVLEGPANGNWVSWYAQFGTSPLVIGYNPKSKFAHDLLTEPWYDVVTKPGFLLGRTDPATDPKGVLAVDALNQAAAAHNLPALKQMATSPSNVFPENTLVGRLQAGQLDAGFFYSVEAAAAKIPTITIPGSTLDAVYTVTVLNNAPNEAGANAFVTFLLGPSGSALLTKAGLDLTTPPKVSGTVPPSLQGAVSG